MPSAGTCLQLDLSIISKVYQYFFQLEAINSKWLVICFHSGVPGLNTSLFNMIW